MTLITPRVVLLCRRSKKQHVVKVNGGAGRAAIQPERLGPGDAAHIYHLPQTCVSIGHVSHWMCAPPPTHPPSVPPTPSTNVDEICSLVYFHPSAKSQHPTSFLHTLPPHTPATPPSSFIQTVVKLRGIQNRGNPAEKHCDWNQS